MLKDASLIVRDKLTEKGRELVIKRKTHNGGNRDTKLGDVLPELPLAKSIKMKRDLAPQRWS